ncbi:uncharacterized protein LOC123296459 [Chrysoperla carnea]|uniref:uncharacterized protein LOC123296459 n=1 Tax=Chrysoperla carnea TaxID=189513 RepID=UPI001D091FE3|nr:uncharacterized protein LOC123296459 [Chrysoperla carnea]
MTTVPDVQSVEFMTMSTTGQGLGYEKLKLFILQAEANKNHATASESAGTAMQAHQGQDCLDRCFECDDLGHIARNCPWKGTGLKKCYGCGQVTSHKAADCPLQKLKQSHSERGRGCSRGSTRGRSNTFRGSRVYQNTGRQNWKRKNNNARGGDAKRFKPNRGRGGYKNFRNNDKRSQQKGKEKDVGANLTETKQNKGK